MKFSRRQLCLGIAALATIALVLSCSTGRKFSEFRDPAGQSSASANLGTPESVIDTQKARLKVSIFAEDAQRNLGNGGRITVGGPAVGGVWQMPPLPDDFIQVRGADGRIHTVTMKMGAIQASVLPSGKVLMVSGSSNRGDNRPQKVPFWTSQSYNLIDNTELFDPTFVPAPPSDPTATPVNAQALEFPVVSEKNPDPRDPSKQKPFLYERPTSLPETEAFKDSPFSSPAGTMTDPKFCAEERPEGKVQLFNNGQPAEATFPPDPAQYCSKIAEIRGGVGIAADPGEPDIDLFCGGHHPLPDGNVLFAGGTRKAVNFTPDFLTPIPFYGIKRTLVFDWKLEQWREAGANQSKVDMGDGRWYPTLVELPDGKIFIIGGMNHRGEISHTLEVYDPKTRAKSELVDFRPLGGTPMPNEPFSVLDPIAGRRFDNFPRVFLTNQQPACNDPSPALHCVRLLITGDGSAEGNRDVGMNNTVYVDLNTGRFPALQVAFSHGPERNLDPHDPRLATWAAQRGQIPPASHKYTTHLYPTTLYDPLSDDKDAYLILGGSIGKYDPLHVAQDAVDVHAQVKVLAPEKSTNFNSKEDHRTVSDMERFNGQGFDPVYEHFLGDEGDFNAKPGTSRLLPAQRGQAVPCDPSKPNDPSNRCGPINGSGMINSNVVILPTRQFLVLGGGNHSYEDPVFNPILFTPFRDPIVQPSGVRAKQVGWNGEWVRTYMNPFHLPRLYHNTALLLPDGRVFLGSGNAFISFLKGIDSKNGLPLVGPLGGQANDYNAFDGAPPTMSIDLPAEQYQVELFDPPYLFIPGPRPVIQGVGVQTGMSRAGITMAAATALPEGKHFVNEGHEDVIGYGRVLSLELGNVTPNSHGRVTFIRVGGVTHAFNFSQRLHTLHAPKSVSANGIVNPNLSDGGIVVPKVSQGGNAPRVTVVTPGSPRVAPPGYYMLFYVNQSGKPSEARMVRLCDQVATPKGLICAEDPS